MSKIFVFFIAFTSLFSVFAQDWVITEEYITNNGGMSKFHILYSDSSEVALNLICVESDIEPKRSLIIYFIHLSEVKFYKPDVVTLQITSDEIMRYSKNKEEFLDMTDGSNVLPETSYRHKKLLGTRFNIDSDGEKSLLVLSLGRTITDIYLESPFRNFYSSLIDTKSFSLVVEPFDSDKSETFTFLMDDKSMKEILLDSTCL